jgi:sugar phosphate permease
MPSVRPPPRDPPASLVLATLVVGYGAFYLCRANVDAALPLLRRDFGYTKTQLGALSSIPIAVYAVGKVVMGAFGDVIGGKRLMLLAAAGSVLATLAFGASSGLVAFALCASLNRFFQAGGWSGAVHVVARRFERPRHGLVMGILSTSYELGNVLSMLLCGAIAGAFAGWRALFVVNPLLFAAVAALLAVALPATPARTRAPAKDKDDERADGETLGQVLAALARQPALWLTVALSVLLTFLRVGFLTWTPMYLSELSRAAAGAEQQRAISGAIVKSAIFPAAGVVAALAVGAASDRFGRGRRAPVMAASLAVVVLLVLLLAHGPVRSQLGAAMLIGGVGLFLLGPYSLLAGAMALDVSGKHGAATASGLIDGAGYLGASAAGVLLGAVADRRGWPAAFDVVAGAALVAMMLAAGWSLSALGRARG